MSSNESDYPGDPLEELRNYFKGRLSEGADDARIAEELEALIEKFGPEAARAIEAVAAGATEAALRKLREEKVQASEVTVVRRNKKDR